MMKKIYSLFIALMFISSAFAQKNLIYVCPTDLATGGVGNVDDQPMIDAIIATGAYTVSYMQAADFTTDNIATINAADVILVSRGTGSSDVLPVRQVFNDVTTPTIQTSPWVIRGDRLAYVTGGTAHQNTDDTKVVSALVVDETHPIFAGVTITGGAMDWTVGFTSDLTAETGVVGTVLAKTADEQVLCVLIDAGTALASGFTPAGPRAYMGNGQDNVEPHNYFNYTDGAKQVFLNLVAYMANMVPAGTNSLNTIENLSVFCANGQITVSMNNLNRVEIYSLDGKMVVNSNANGDTMQLNSDLRNGLYIAKAYSNNGQSASARFVVR